ncbi:Dynein light chain Tctex-type 1 [Galemys pyrenaicus]|uniref:Dynein light chain Tctex-type 1 n=1 Tax=Galemys pyrenaicus TaxID=202257 RepID=A0A8J6AIP9_GALPY|nr:Dynein light chain Tctex-type 1 [Galemys pyrenaicus]
MFTSRSSRLPQARGAQRFPRRLRAVRLDKNSPTAFVVDEVSNIVKEAIESAIGGNAYQHSKVNQWTTNVVEQTLSQLTKLGKPFKYIVPTCPSPAGSCTVRWENKTMYCIVSAFGLSI